MTKIKYIEAKDNAGLELIQDRAVKSVNSARANVQIALVATILHMAQHSNWTYASRLVDSLGNSVNGSAVVEWFKRFGNLSTDDTGFTGFTNKDVRASIASTLDKAKETMWWNLKVQNPYKGFNLDAAMQKLIKDSKAAQARAIANPKDAELINVTVNEATLQALLAVCNFDAILADAVKTDKVADEVSETVNA